MAAPSAYADTKATNAVTATDEEVAAGEGMVVACWDGVLSLYCIVRLRSTAIAND